MIKVYASLSIRTQHACVYIIIFFRLNMFILIHFMVYLICMTNYLSCQMWWMTEDYPASVCRQVHVQEARPNIAEGRSKSKQKPGLPRLGSQRPIGDTSKVWTAGPPSSEALDIYIRHIRHIWAKSCLSRSKLSEDWLFLLYSEFSTTEYACI